MAQTTTTTTETQPPTPTDDVDDAPPDVDDVTPVIMDDEAYRTIPPVKITNAALDPSAAANSSTAGKEQFLALQREEPSVRLDEKEAGAAHIKVLAAAGHDVEYEALAMIRKFCRHWQ